MPAFLQSFSLSASHWQNQGETGCTKVVVYGRHVQPYTPYGRIKKKGDALFLPEHCRVNAYEPTRLKCDRAARSLRSRVLTCIPRAPYGFPQENKQNRAGICECYLTSVCLQISEP